MFQFRFEQTSHFQEKTQTQFRVGMAKSSTIHDEYDPTREIISNNLNHFETSDLKFVGRIHWLFCEMYFANGDYPRESAQSCSIKGFY